MKHNKELKTYQKMLSLFIELRRSVDNKFLDRFNKYWNKYHANEFRN